MRCMVARPYLLCMHAPVRMHALCMHAPICMHSVPALIRALCVVQDLAAAMQREGRAREAATISALVVAVQELQLAPVFT